MWFSYKILRLKIFTYLFVFLLFLSKADSSCILVECTWILKKVVVGKSCLQRSIQASLAVEKMTYMTFLRIMWCFYEYHVKGSSFSPSIVLGKWEEGWELKFLVVGNHGRAKELPLSRWINNKPMIYFILFYSIIYFLSSSS
jgi:hypothetical protein